MIAKIGVSSRGLGSLPIIYLPSPDNTFGIWTEEKAFM
jgi:hypothetical protein